MHKLLLSLLISCLLLACGKASDSSVGPKKLSDSLWVEVLSDMYIHEAFKNKRGVAGKDITQEVLWLDSVALKSHGLTQEEFNKAYRNLGKDLHRISGIYDQVLERLSKLESEIQSDSTKVYSFPLRRD